MSRVAIVARLKPGAEPQAAALLEGGPPFDPDEQRVERHAVYLSASEVVFVFEGPEVEWAVDDLVDAEPSAAFQAAVEVWRPLVEGPPRIARLAYAWERGES
jgi:hypothetical protein